MRKLFIKVMLFGLLALLGTSTFVSCKDYDDDIDGLKESVATTNSDFKTKIDALNASISSLQSSQSDLTNAINAAKDDATKAALQAKADAIASSLANMNSIKTELTALINANITDIKALNQNAKDAESKLASLEGELSAVQQMLVGYSDLVETVGRIQSAMTRIDQVANTLETLSAEVKKATEDIAKQQTMLETQQGAISKLDADSKQKFGDIDAQLTTLLKDLELQKSLLDKAATKEDVAAVQANVDANKAAISDLSERVGALEGHLNILESFFFNMITAISFEENLTTNFNVDFTAVKCDADRIFGEGLQGAISFKKDQLYTVPATSVYIQVSPSTSEITPEMLDIVKSNGESIKSYLDITVEAYNKAITRGSSQGGIWAVTAQLKNNYNKASFAQATKVDGKSYLFAIATTNQKIEVLNNSPRIVASPYKLAFTDGGTNYTHLLDVNATSVNNVAIGNNIPVEINKSFDVNVKSSNGAKIYACYATLKGNDDQKIVWRSYGVTGYDNVVKGDVLTLKVPSANANGKVVSFTLYAIDFSGNEQVLKDFSVVCGNQNTNAPSLNATLEPAAPSVSSIYNTTKLNLSANLATTDPDALNLENATYAVSLKDKDGNDMTGVSALFFKKDLTTQVSLTSAAGIKDIAAVQLFGINLTKIANDGSVTGNINFTNTNGLLVLSVPVTLTKKMPAFPSGFSAKTGMLNAGVITVFPVFNGDGTKATFAYSKIFNMIDGSNSSYFAFASKADQGTKMDFSDPDNIAVDNSFVGSQGQNIDMKVSYNYGPISSVATDNNNWKPVWGTPFAIKFVSIPEESAITLDKAFSIQYPLASKVLIHHSAANDGGYIITKADDKNTTLMMLKEGTYQIKTISLKTITVENGLENEYYIPTLNSDGSVTFTKRSDSAVVNADVPSQLVITITDVFGNNKIEKKLSFTVVKP